MTSLPLALIVDDEWRLAQNLARFLERRGFATRTVTSVGDASIVITEQRPDLALVDLKLPDFSGAALCRMLQLRYPETPVIVMSARIDEAEHQQLRELGVEQFLTKPFALGELDLALQRLRVPCAGAQRAGHKTTTARVRPVQVGAESRDAKRPRVVLYSHDTMGLGHMRRNILIARSLTESRLGASVLLVSGAREIGRFDLPPGIDCLVLPSYRKSDDGNYASRHLDMQARELVRMRSHTISASVGAFDPDVMVVDNVPRGALNELDATLAAINAKGRTRMVLGLRDVLDAPEATRDEWQRRNNLDAIHWHYDQVWVYGDPAVYNLCERYRFGSGFDAKVRFTGYLDARRRAAPRGEEVTSQTGTDVAPETAPYDLCLVGGGQDGFALSAAFAAAQHPAGVRSVLITGPFMSPEQTEILQRIAAGKPGLEVRGFVKEPTRLLRNARRVVAMGGYNTVNEVLAFRRPTLIVPRVRPRLEQLERAQRLAELGHVDMLHPDELHAAALSDWLQKPSDRLPSAAVPIDLDGLDRLIDYIEHLTNEQGTDHATA